MTSHIREFRTPANYLMPIPVDQVSNNPQMVQIRAINGKMKAESVLKFCEQILFLLFAKCLILWIFIFIFAARFSINYDTEN